MAAWTPDDRLDLVDLWTGEPRLVREPDADDLEPGDLVAARLMTGAGGELIMEGSALLYPPDVKDDVMAVLRGTYQRVVSHLPAVSEAVFFKSTAPVLHFFWLLRVATAASSPCIEAVFDVVAAARLETVLTSHPDIEKDDDGGYLWVDRDGTREEDLGTFTVGAGQLVFHADSEELAERGRRMIERAAGAALRYAGIHAEEIDGTDGDDDDAPPLPPEVTAER